MTEQLALGLFDDRVDAAAVADEPARPPAPDQPARDRIHSDLGSTLFVEAGAGSGKTTALVDRVLALVTSGEVELEHIAAITFTEKAGAELQDRLRQALEEAAAKPSATADIATRCAAARDALDGAAIGTLHAFAQRILSEHPIEAGLPPRVEVLDEVSSDVEFDLRWRRFQDELLADPALERTLLLFFAAGVKVNALRVLAESFDNSWDLVADRVPEKAPDPPQVLPAINEALRGIDDAVAMASRCRVPGDKLVERLDELAAFAARLRAMDDELDVLEALDDDAPEKPPSFKVRVGRKESWDGSIEEVRSAVGDAGARLEAALDEVKQACVHRIAVELRRFTLAAAEERRAAGRLQFHDLLVMARALLTSPEHGAAVRTSLARRYQRLLLDEFQDTDPIQIELAVRIAAAEPRSPEAGTLPWAEVPIAPGRLFVVGDPKQSIYRFRRADIAVFLAAQARYGPPVELTANFRTGDTILGWINDTFATLMDLPDDVELSLPSQPRYVALEAVRPAPAGDPAVSVLGRNEHGDKASADEIRSAEAAEVAAAVARMMDEAWQVDDGKGGWRDATLGDVCVLVPARTSLPFLESAFERAGISYRAESSSLVYATRAVRDVLMVLRAIDDPTDHLRIVSALRTPLLGCGDDDLFRFKVERRGHWGYAGDQPESVPADDIVGMGLACLRRLHTLRHWKAPSELLEQIVRERRALELGFADGRPRDVWRRLRFVIDQARAWHEATGGTLRDYLHWIDQQTAEGARVAEAILPETDDEAVRIMTIHAAKGLEFPITIVSGMSTGVSHRTAPAEVVFPSGGGLPGYRFGRKVATDEYEDWKPIDEQMSFHERIRLLYVACTRARDHLVVSLHRKARKKPPEKISTKTNAELFVDGMGVGLDDVADAVERVGGVITVRAPTRPTAPPPYAEWAAERAGALATASVPGTVAATALTDEGDLDQDDEVVAGLDKRGRDMDLPPWLKGRYGTAVGRAVHGVLQTIDLATGAGLDAAVSAQCEAEAIPDRQADVRRLVGHALASDVVQEAARSPHWREVYVCAPMDDGRLLEGYIDLLYRGPDGLVVVDYKTTASLDDAELDRRVDGYSLQGSAYARSVAASTGEPVARVAFAFVSSGGFILRELSVA